ncbi:NAP domain-containing protein, partial [Candidatus Bathyarchaeota archaeon]|nr:NAP domain-containing protein [Candidatus Bathyarchaeota archaeon]
LSAPLYEKRAALVGQIPNFWPLVLEAAPPEVDEFVQPSDSALFLSSLKNVSLKHFELEAGGDPRSFSVAFEFGDNEHFEDKVIEKKFWYRHDKSLAWSGLVSEPVDITWKAGKDLTEGLLALTKKVWEEEQAGIRAGKPVKGWTATRKELHAKIEEKGLGGLSFFTWFGFIGTRVSAAESADADRRERERRQMRKAGKEVPEEEDEDDEEEEEILEEIEVCPFGSDLAVSISEDLWPTAIKYFSESLSASSSSCSSGCAC